jgi:hypothetical protein
MQPRAIPCLQHGTHLGGLDAATVSVAIGSELDTVLRRCCVCLTPDGRHASSRKFRRTEPCWAPELPASFDLGVRLRRAPVER